MGQPPPTRKIETTAALYTWCIFRKTQFGEKQKSFQSQTAHIWMCAVLQQDIVTGGAREDESETSTSFSETEDDDVVLEQIGWNSSDSENIPLSVLAESIREVQHSHSSGQESSSDSDLPLSSLRAWN